MKFLNFVVLCYIFNLLKLNSSTILLETHFEKIIEDTFNPTFQLLL
jgi:hypothetical protein